MRKVNALWSKYNQMIESYEKHFFIFGLLAKVEVIISLL